MHLILTGATGLIGSAALQSALSHPSITKVSILTRRDPLLTHPKLSVILKSDFSTYTRSELAQLKGASACIWALGAPTSGLEVHVKWPTVAMETFGRELAGCVEGGGKFTFLLLSGGLVVRDQSRWLPGFTAPLKARGRVETEFVEFEARHGEKWRSFVARPWMVLQPGSWSAALYPGGFSITVDVLGAALVDVVVSGGKVQTLENGELKRTGTKALAERKA